MLYPWTSITIFQLKSEIMNAWFLLFLSYCHVPWLIIIENFLHSSWRNWPTWLPFSKNPPFFPFFSYNHVPESGSWHLRLWNHLPWPGVQMHLSVSLVIAKLLSEFCWSHPPIPAPFLRPAILLLMGLNIELFTVFCHLFAPLPYFSCLFFIFILSYISVIKWK